MQRFHCTWRKGRAESPVWARNLRASNEGVGDAVRKAVSKIGTEERWLNREAPDDPALGGRGGVVLGGRDTLLGALGPPASNNVREDERIRNANVDAVGGRGELLSRMGTGIRDGRRDARLGGPLLGVDRPAPRRGGVGVIEV